MAEQNETYSSPITSFTQNDSLQVQMAARDLRFKFDVNIEGNTDGLPNTSSEQVQQFGKEVIQSADITRQMVDKSWEARVAARKIRFG